MSIGPVFVSQFLKLQGSQSVGPIVITLLLLFNDRLKLIPEVLFRYIQRSHPVRLEPQCQLQIVRGHGLVIVRPVLTGCGIPTASGVVDITPVLVFGHIF